MAETIKSFKGGYRFRNILGAPRNGMIEEIPFPDKVIIPLKQGFCDPLSPLVRTGETVRAGQIIARDDDNLSTPLHATIRGTVETIAMTGRGRRQRPHAIVIRGDGSREWQPVAGVPSSWETATADEIGQLLYLSGVSALGEAGIPTRCHSSPIEPESTRAILVGAVDASPLGLPSACVVGDGRRFVTGLAILRRALHDAAVHVAVARDNEALRNTIETAARGCDWLRVHPVKMKYPADAGVVLAAMLLGRTARSNQAAIDLGAVVIDPQTAIHACDALVDGKPLLERLVALGGSGFSRPAVARVRIGTPYERLAAGRIANGIEPRLVADGIIAGRLISDATEPIERRTTQVSALAENRRRELLAFLRPGLEKDSFSNSFLSVLRPGGAVAVDTNIHGGYRPCIACSYCDMVCPVNLYPHRLNKYVEHDLPDGAFTEKILTCIDCGLCSYVCPSKIPLMHNMIEGKAQIIKKGWHSEVEAGSAEKKG